MNAKTQTIIIVENDANYRLMLRETLEELDCQILDASKPDDAVQIVEARPPNLIIRLYRK